MLITIFEKISNKLKKFIWDLVRMALREFSDGVEWCDTIHDHYWKLVWTDVRLVTKASHWIFTASERPLGGTRSIHWTTARLGCKLAKIIADESWAVGGVVTVGTNSRMQA